MNLRKYGKPPFTVVVVHGGPGAAGEMAPLAREMSLKWSILEPLQTASSLNGQVEELKKVIQSNAHLPAAVIGFSWGAWLSFICAAYYPQLIKKLILIGAAPFEDKYAAYIHQSRLNRLSKRERDEVICLTRTLSNPESQDKNSAFKRFGELFTKADTYAPIKRKAEGSEFLDFQADIFLNIWPEAAQLRTSGNLLKLARHITCPVTAIHGDYDPHPPEGVKKPLSLVLKDFRFILLKNCGHKPWIELYAREEFLRVVEQTVEEFS